jgi:MFS family permease
MSIYMGFRGGARQLLVASFLMSLAGGMTSFVLILFMYELTTDLGLLGRLVSLSTWTAVVFFIPGGLLVDRLDRRVTLALSLLFSAAGMGVFSVAQDLTLIVVGQILLGIAFSISFPTLTALMSEKTSDVRRKYLFSMQSFVNMMGVAIATIMAGILTVVLQSAFSMSLEATYRLMFVISAAGMVCSIVIALRLRPGEEDRENKAEALSSMFEAEGDSKETSRKSLLFVVKYYTPMTIIGFGAGWVIPFFQLYYLLKFHVDVADIAWLFAATQVSMGLSFFLIPALAERRGSVGAVTGTWGAATATLAAIPLAPTFLMAAPLHLVRMALMNASSPISDSLMMGVVRARDRGKAAGLTRFMWTAMNGIGMTFAGDLMAKNLDLPFVITVSCYIVATILFWKWFRKLGEM